MQKFLLRLTLLLCVLTTTFSSYNSITSFVESKTSHEEKLSSETKNDKNNNYVTNIPEKLFTSAAGDIIKAFYRSLPRTNRKPYSEKYTQMLKKASNDR